MIAIEGLFLNACCSSAMSAPKRGCFTAKGPRGNIELPEQHERSTR